MSHVDAGFAAEIAAAVGVDAPGGRAGRRAAGAEDVAGPLDPAGPPGSLATRRVAILCADGVRAAQVREVETSLRREGARPEVIAVDLGTVASDAGPLEVTHALRAVASVVFDAVFIPGGAASVATLTGDPRAVRFVEEAYRHLKTIGYAREAEALFVAATGDAAATAGVVTGPDADAEALARGFLDAMRLHRHFERGSRPCPRMSLRNRARRRRRHPRRGSTSWRATLARSTSSSNG